MAEKLGLYELLAPYFLAGFAIDWLDFLDELGVEELHVAADNQAIVYTGVAAFGGNAAALSEIKLKGKGGATFSSGDFRLPFRLTIPRNRKSPAIQGAIDGLNAIGGNLGSLPVVMAGGYSTQGIVIDGFALQNINRLLDLFDDGLAVPAAPNLSDPASMAFRLELMVSDLSFSLGTRFKPGKIEGDRVLFDHVYPRDTVRIVLPRVVLEYTQGVDLNVAPDFRLKSWGASGFDEVTDLAAGELIRMEPEVAIHESGRCGFKLGAAFLDLSPNSTPLEILNHFGVDDDWMGIYLKSLSFYYGDPAKDWGFAIGVEDALFSFTGEVSLEAFAAVLAPDDFQFKVLFFDGMRPIDYAIGEPSFDPTTVHKGGVALLPPNAALQLAIAGGVPHYSLTASYEGQSLDWNEASDTLYLPAGLPMVGQLVIALSDATGKTLHHKIDLILSPSQQPSQPAIAPGLVNWVEDGGLPPGHQIVRLPSSPNSYRENFRVIAPNGNLQNMTLTVTDTATQMPVIDALPLTSADFGLEIPAGKTYHIAVNLQGSASEASEYFDLRYTYERPRITEYPQCTGEYVSNFTAVGDLPLDYAFLSSSPPASAGSLPPANSNSGVPVASGGAEALRAWLTHRVKTVNNAKAVEVFSYSSYEGYPEKAPYNFDLSARRLNTTYAILKDYSGKADYGGATVQILNEVPPAALSAIAFGQQKAEAGELLHDAVNASDPYPPDAVEGVTREGNLYDRVTVIKATVANLADLTLGGTLSRSADNPVPIPISIPLTTFPPSPKKPDFFRKIKIRVRIERNVLVFLELFGEFDFETQLEKTLRSKAQVTDKLDTPPNGPFLMPNPGDGIVNFTLTVSYDTATHFLSESLSLHSDDADKDGLIECPNSGSGGVYRLRNAVGAMMVLSPILVSATGQSEASTANTAADWAELAVDWLVPASLGASNILQIQKIILFGGSLKARQYVPPNNQALPSDQGIFFDYGVEFGIDLNPVIDLKTQKPLRIRYNSVGFNVHTSVNAQDQPSFQTIFDPSKGYSLDLSDPSLFALKPPLGDLIKVLGARIAQFNPLTLELDLGVNADLGVVTVDRFLVKWPISPLGVPMILPSGVKVNIPGTLIGDGYLHFMENGFEGGLDVTLVPLKLRIAAVLAVQHLEDVTAVFASLVVDFPSPIVLGATGLGIYSLSGLFAMHYKRLEDPRKEGDPIGPALKWLQKAEGKPTQLSNSAQIPLWAAQKDRWSFGVGAVLGTLDGGFLDNLMGMFILELPGPRILICVKMKVIAELPGLDDSSDVQQLTVGMLGVLDLDFGQKRVTLGVIIDFAIAELLAISLPIELFFDWQKPENWHLYIGTFSGPASADILGIVKGSAYFMIGGQACEPSPEELPPLNILGGIYAPMIFGSEAIGLYLELSVRADFGVSFTPFYVAGLLTMRGELHLWVISIEAHATLLLQAPPAYFRGEICGHVDLFLFTVEGCVEVEAGEQPPVPASLPPLVNGVFLQSFAPVLASGQGGDRPIDASLGNAIATGSPEPLPVVPIDSIPVMQMVASPLVGAASEQWASGSPQAATTFTAPLKVAPGNTDGTGTVRLGADRLRYQIESLQLWQKPVGSNNFQAVNFGNDKPPVVWRKIKAASNNQPNTQIELAINSRAPFNTPYALERSTELTTIVEETWQDICTPAAPPTSVLWTFCDQSLGESGKGWQLDGIPLPDPPNTLRETPPKTDLFVGEPTFSDAEKFVRDIAQTNGDNYPIPACVVGMGAASPKEQGRVRCYRALQIPRLLQHNATNSMVKPVDYATLQAQIQEKAWVTLNIGRSQWVRLYLLAEGNWREGIYEIWQLDSQGQVVDLKSLHQMPYTMIQNFNQLPGTWQDSTLPWLVEIQPLFSFLQGGKPEFRTMQQLLLEFKPHPAAIALFIKAKSRVIRKRYTLLVGAVETLSMAEVARSQHESSKQQSEQETVNDYLEQGDPVPLLLPNCEYRLDVTYKVGQLQDVDLGNGLEPIPSVSTSQQVQSFHFQTDSLLPARLDPWILGTAPYQEERYHFYKEPFVVVFNNTAVAQLFAAYNAKLQYHIHGANGSPVLPPENDLNGQPIPNLDLNGGPNDLNPLSDVQIASLGSPFYDTLLDLTDRLPCIDGAGKHQEQTVSIIKAEFKPLMDYTLDILPEKVDPAKPLQIQPVVDLEGLPMKGDLPFFRRRFRTSRYADIASFAADLRSQKLTFKVLTGAIAGLPQVTSAVTDRELADALILAGEEALPAPEGNRIVMYWRNDKPYALLLETVEPVWRDRLEPQLQPAQSPNDDYYDATFKKVVMATAKDLELTDGQKSYISYFLHANGGTRTLAFINPAKIPALNQPPVTFSLVLNRPVSPFLQRDAEALACLQITLSDRPPWAVDPDLED